MGTKNNPGKFDCYANAEPDEPMFVLLGRDPIAFILVETWAAIREKMGTDAEKLTEARECAKKLEEWARQKGKHSQIDQALMLCDDDAELKATIRQRLGIDD